MKTTRFTALVLLAFLLPGSLDSKSHKKKKPGAQSFSYYMLVLSYAPDFCQQPQGDKDPRECGTGRRVGFVVHGLWPQGENSRGPEHCGSPAPLSSQVIQATLPYVPTESLIQHEWAAHGTCSGLGAADYFAALRQARDLLTLPADLSQPAETLRLSPGQIESKLAAANPRFPAAAFRVSCYNQGELQEIRICLNKDLSPRACGSSAGECQAADVTMLPVR